MNNDARYNVEIKRLRKRLAELEAIVAKLPVTEQDPKATKPQRVRRAVNRLLAAADRSIAAADETQQALDELARLAPDGPRRVARPQPTPPLSHRR